jgi:hypothetical protein
MAVEGSQNGFWRGLWSGPLALYRIRFGKGVLGRLTTNLIAILSVLGPLAAVSLAFGYPLIAIGRIVVCVGVYFNNHISTMRFAYQNPDAALLEGADFVRVREIEMAMKDLPSSVSAPNIEAPVIDAIAVDDNTVQPEREMGKNSNQSSDS